MAGQGKDPFEGLGEFAKYFRDSPYFNPELSKQQKREEIQLQPQPLQPQQPQQQPTQESKKQEATSTAKLSPEDQDLAAKIRQVEVETKGDKDTRVREERVLTLLKPRLGGKKPEELIYVCQLEHSSGSFNQHTYFALEAENLPGATLPNPAVIPPHIAHLFRGTLEPCLQHAIEFSIGVTGAHIGQKKIVPYELLPAPAKNQQELERLVVAASQDYRLVSKEISLPSYMKERRRKVAAVLFDNAEVYEKNEQARQQIVQLLRQIDDAITLRSEGNASEGEVRQLIAKLREKPTAPAPSGIEKLLPKGSLEEILTVNLEEILTVKIVYEGRPYEFLMPVLLNEFLAIDGEEGYRLAGKEEVTFTGRRYVEDAAARIEAEQKLIAKDKRIRLRLAPEQQKNLEATLQQQQSPAAKQSLVRMTLNYVNE